MSKNRRSFIKKMVLSTTALGLFPLLAKPKNNKSIDKELVFEFVKAGHNDLTKVKNMLREQPGLLNSAWDWGNGDFETAIGGAGHVGNKEIAKYLISKGARVNLFTLAMLGETEIVIHALKVYPDLIHSKGPHGFSLLHHANVGGERAIEIKSYLTKSGLNQTKIEQ